MSAARALVGDLGIVVSAIGLLFIFAVPGSAQGIPGLEVVFYGYFSDDGETVLQVGELTSDQPGLAAEMVSPRYVDDFFSGYTAFTNYDFAADLPSRYIDQVDEADEYMVFAGDLDGVDGVKPGYVMLLSAQSKVFMLVGYQTDGEDLFALAAATIDEGQAPEDFQGYTRILTSGDESAGGEESNSDSQESRQPATDLSIFCANDSALEIFDTNGDGLITVDELTPLSGFEEIDNLLAAMEANGYDAIQYADC